MTTVQEIDFDTFIPKLDHYLARGLIADSGDPNGQMCIEAAVCAALAVPFGSNPTSVEQNVLRYRTCLNDADWSSPEARARGLRDLGIATVGSAGVVNGSEFAASLADKTIRVLIPRLLRDMGDEKCLEAALHCEDTTKDIVLLAIEAAESLKVAKTPVEEATLTAGWAMAGALVSRWSVICLATASLYANTAAVVKNGVNDDRYLILSASLALEVLRELKSPGCKYV